MVTSQNREQLWLPSRWRGSPFIIFLPLMLMVLGWCSISHASDKFVNEIATARTIYLDVVASGDKRTLRKAIKQINGLAQRYPGHPLVMIYQGCILAERGRDEGQRPVNRMQDTDEGLQLIDRGLRQLQQGDLQRLDAAEARLMAAMLFLHLPDTVFHRLQQGEALVVELLTDSRFDEMPAPLQAGIYFAAAIVADKNSDKAQLKHYLELSLKASPEGYSASKARAMLSALVD